MKVKKENRKLLVIFACGKLKAKGNNILYAPIVEARKIALIGKILRLDGVGYHIQGGLHRGVILYD